MRLHIVATYLEAHLMATKAARAKAKISKRLTESLLEAVKIFCAKKGFVSNITKEPGTPEVYGQLGSELKRNIQDSWSASGVLNYDVYVPCVRWQNVVTSRGNVWGVETGLLHNKVVLESN